MLNPFSKHPEYLAALDRVKAWTRGRFDVFFRPRKAFMTSITTPIAVARSSISRIGRNASGEPIERS